MVSDLSRPVFLTKLHALMPNVKLTDCIFKKMPHLQPVEVTA